MGVTLNQTIDDYIDTLINELEGEEYTNHPWDAGGETKFGITKNLARKHGYYLDMKSLARECAISIYKEEFGRKLQLGAINEKSPLIAFILLVQGVHVGTERMAKTLQSCLNILNNEETYYKDIAEDGIIGRLTLHSLNSYIDHRGEDGIRTLANMLNTLIAAFYVDLAKMRKKDEKNIYGWYNKRVDLIIRRIYGI